MEPFLSTENGGASHHSSLTCGSPAAVLSPDLPPSVLRVVTPWRVELARLLERAAAFIIAEADPEDALRAARDAGHDMAHQVKLALIRAHGMTFDPIIDGQDAPTRSRAATLEETEQQLLGMLGKCPGTTRAQLAFALYGHADEVRTATLGPIINALIARGAVYRHPAVHGQRSVPYRYSLVHGAA